MSFLFMGEHFETDEYGDSGWALYHEGMFVTELPDKSRAAAYLAAYEYMCKVCSER